MFEKSNDIYGEFSTRKSSVAAEFSVVIGAYNSEETIVSSLESLFLSSNPNVEVVIINDGSTDGTLQKIIQYAESYPSQFTIVDQANIGLTKSLNRGIDLASGQFIVRQDADDFSYSNRMAELGKALSDADFVVSQADVLSVDKRFIKKSTRSYYYKNGVESLKLIFGNPFVHGTFAFRKSIYGKVKYDEDFRFSQDYDFLLQVLRLGLRVKFIEQSLYAFVKNTKSISATRRNEQSEIAKRILVKHGLTDRFYLSNKHGIKKLAYIAVREFVILFGIKFKV